jgi:molybdopterin guanine dinucleotide-containing S/N-oxide reductase-like protein
MPEVLQGEQVFTNCTQGGPIFVHVKDGKIVRIRPIVFDDKEEVSTWTIEAQGKKYSAPRKVTLAPYVLTQRYRTYSENRLPYPMMRVDFDPNGERHPENRGKSGYKRISWEKALDVVAGEMKRIRSKYGSSAIMSNYSSHHEWGNVGYKFGTWSRFFNLLGFTDVFANPDSWEGWLWGASHCAGFYWRLGIPEQCDLLEDALKHTELIIHWGDDPDGVFGVYGGQESAIWRLWLRDLGIKQIFIDPFCNYSAGIQASKWIAPRPGTDSAIALAIAYVWLQDGTYDKKYIQDKTIGFEEFKKYVLGEEDGVPKTPQWAAEKAAIPARDIYALARGWASKRTSISAGARGGFSGICREAYATEWARLVILLQAMQGLGKPGISIWGTTSGAPHNTSFYFPGYSDWGPAFLNKVAKKPAINSVPQRVYRLLIPDAILNPPIHWVGEGICGKSLEQQFKPYTYPHPGMSEIRMYYRYGGSFIGTMTDTSKYVDMYQSPQLEFVVNQDIWNCTETNFADIILPACSNFERNDIGEWSSSGGYAYETDSCNHRMIIYQQKAIEPLYESKPDYWIFSELADRLGFKEDFTEGNTIEDWIEKVFYQTDLPKYISFAEFKKKGYFVVPLPPDYQPTPAFRWFLEGKDCNTNNPFNPKKGTEKGKELGTYSGKIEFVSQSLLKNFPDDNERPPLPHYIPSWEGHESELAGKYPLQLIAPHPRFSFHTHHDLHTPWLSEIPIHRVYKDGYPYRTVRLSPPDAEARGIQHGDIVKLYNDRGGVLGIADVTERMKPGVVHMYTSSGKYDPLEPGKRWSVERAGCVNILTSGRMMAKNVPGMAPNSTLIEIVKWET